MSEEEPRRDRRTDRCNGEKDGCEGSQRARLVAHGGAPVEFCLDLSDDLLGLLGASTGVQVAHRALVEFRLQFTGIAVDAVVVRIATVRGGVLRSGIVLTDASRCTHWCSFPAQRRAR